MKMDILIYGAGGHAKVVFDLLRSNSYSQYNVIGFVDPSPSGQVFCGLPIFEKTPANHFQSGLGVVAIGENFSRGKLVKQLQAIYPEARFLTVVHPSAVIGADVSIGEGTVIMPGAVINTGTRIGSHCIVNTKSSADHDCVLEDFASLAPGVTLGGSCSVGEFSAVSLGANLIHGVSIGGHTVVGAGSLVLENITSLVVAFGTPCRVIRVRNPDDRYL